MRANAWICHQNVQMVDGRKVFINVCQSPMIKSFSMQKRIDGDGKEQEGLSIPLSCGRPRADTDKSKIV